MAVTNVMKQVIDLMTELPSPKAEFAKVIVRYRDEKKTEKGSYDVIGWVNRKDGDLIEIYTPYGNIKAIRNGEKKQVDHYERSPGSRLRSPPTI